MNAPVFACSVLENPFDSDVAGKPVDVRFQLDAIPFGLELCFALAWDNLTLKGNRLGQWEFADAQVVHPELATQLAVDYVEHQFSTDGARQRLKGMLAANPVRVVDAQVLDVSLTQDILSLRIQSAEVQDRASIQIFGLHVERDHVGSIGFEWSADDQFPFLGYIQAK